MLNRNETNIPITATDETGRAFASARNNVKMLGSEGAKLSRVFAGFGVGLGVAALARDIISVNKEFEKASREVNSLLNLSEAGFRDLQDDIRGVAGAMGIDLVDATKAAYQAISAGVDRKDLSGFLRTSATAAVAGLSDTETAVDVLSTVVNSFGADTITAARAADVLFSAVKDGKTTFSELARTLSKAAPLAAATGVDFEELAAAVAAITKRGAPTAEAMTQIRAVMIALKKPTGDMAKIFKQLGVANGDALIKSRGFKGALDQLTSTAKKNGIAITKIFSETEALNGVLNLTGKNAAGFGTSLSNAYDSAGASAAAFAENNQTLDRNLQKVRASWQATVTAFGETKAVNAYLDKFAQGLNTIAGLLSGEGWQVAAYGDLEEVLPGINREIHGLSRAWEAYQQASSMGLENLAAMLKDQYDAKVADYIATQNQTAAQKDLNTAIDAQPLPQDSSKLERINALVRQISEARATPSVNMGVLESEIAALHESLRSLDDENLHGTEAWADTYISALQKTIKLEQMRGAEIKKNNAAHADAAKLLDDMSKEGSVSMDDVFTAMDSSAPGSKAWEEWRDSGLSAQQMVVHAMQNASDSMTDSFMEFIETGKFNFSDFISSMLKDIARLVFQQSVANPFAQAISSGIGGVFGGPKAAGGPVSGGTTYLVGEKGPELFTPGRSGGITPNNQLGSPNQAPVNITFRVDTYDSASFDQGIAQRRRMIVGMVDEALNRRGRRGATQ